MPVDQLGKIFVIGTGRSGTTLLQNILASHPDVYGFPVESKFIVEGDGLSALIPRLTDEFSITAADLALLRFMEMFGRHVPQSNLESELDLRLADKIGPENIDPVLDRYLDALIDKRFADVVYPKHFADRSELIALSRQFVAELFGGLALKHGKVHWTEKTPSSLIAVDLLWELFPEATVVHIKRDPRGVLKSFTEQDWLPRQFDAVATLLEHIYWRWSRLKPRLGLNNRRYVEIKLEDLASDPRSVLKDIAEISGLDDRFPAQAIAREKVDGWKSSMPAAHRRYCEERFQPYFGLMGYEI